VSDGRTRSSSKRSFRDNGRSPSGREASKAVRVPATRREDRALTAREREVLQLAAEGGSTREIAAVLFLSPGTVKTHLHNVYGKLGARDRASAVANGMRRGLID
jgi:DNA-binding NarL/FixJ family response regulator